MDQLVFKMEEPPEMGLEDSPMFKMEPSNDSSMFKMEPSNDSSIFKMDPSDLDVDFGPQMRTRSNTWPLPRPDNYVDEPSPPHTVKTEDYETLGELGALLSESKCNGVLSGLPASGSLAGIKKTATSRRNAWGPSSYADLISQAITSSPEQRLTLSQIYDWMIQNVPYFKDKGDSNSSAGWKNSIRHNLSLHSKFMRVQNEGTGKSSWWMLNPDASKAGKSARRRATSMETSKFEKRRGRVKKKVEALRNGVTPSPSSSVSESLDLFPEDSPIHFQLSPDYRQRASSNASSCGGRLSPIPSQEQWLPYTGSYMGVADSLAGSMEATMKLGSDYMPYPSPPPYSNHASPSGGYGPPPPYACPHHLVNSCNCHNHPAMKQQSISPSYQNSPSPSPPATVMGQVLSSLNPSVLDDFSLNIESLQGFDCNVDEVIRHELSMEGGLDFNFPSAGAPMMTSSAPSQPCTTTEPNTVFSTSGQSWVH